MLTEQIKAYCAGFFDGEGNIHIRKYVKKEDKPHSHDGYGLVVCAAQNIIDPLLVLKENYNGSICIHKQKYRGTIKYHHRWTASGPTAGLFLNSVYPYLIVKRKQAELAISLQDRIKNTGRPNTLEELVIRGVFRDNIHSLNTSGVGKLN